MDERKDWTKVDGDPETWAHTSGLCVYSNGLKLGPGDSDVNAHAHWGFCMKGHNSGLPEGMAYPVFGPQVSEDEAFKAVEFAAASRVKGPLRDVAMGLVRMIDVFTCSSREVVTYEGAIARLDDLMLYYCDMRKRRPVYDASLKTSRERVEAY